MIRLGGGRAGPGGAPFKGPAGGHDGPRGCARRAAGAVDSDLEDTRGNDTKSVGYPRVAFGVPAPRTEPGEPRLAEARRAYHPPSRADTG